MISRQVQTSRPGSNWVRSAHGMSQETRGERWSQTPRLPGDRSGFTMVEILIVMMILGILVALLVPAFSIAQKRAADAKAFSEVKNLQMAVESFRSERKVFPPSRMHLLESQSYNRNYEFDRFSAEYLGKIFPNIRLRWSKTGGSTLAPSDRFLWCDDQVGGKMFDQPGTWQGKYCLEGDECLVFFLGGISSFIRDSSTRGLAPDSPPVQLHGFSSNPSNPSGIPTPTIPGTEQRTKIYFEFEGGRLFVRAAQADGGNLPYVNDIATPAASDWNITAADRQSDKLPSYRDTFSTKEEPRPYAYFSSYEGRGYRPWDCAIPFPFEATEEQRLPYFQQLYPTVTKQRGGTSILSHPEDVMGPNPYTSSDPAPDLNSAGTGTTNVQAFDATSFQIIGPGRDHMYGKGGQLGVKDMNMADKTAEETSVFFNYDADNVTSLGSGKFIGDYNRDLMQDR